MVALVFAMRILSRDVQGPDRNRQNAIMLERLWIMRNGTPKAWHQNAQTRNGMLVRSGPDGTGPDRNVNHVSSLHLCQDHCAMENCIFPAVLGPSGSAGAWNGPERIVRKGRKLGPVRNGYIQNGTRSGTDRTGPDRFIPEIVDQSYLNLDKTFDRHAAPKVPARWAQV